MIFMAVSFDLSLVVTLFGCQSINNMGVFQSREEFRWGDRYELIDSDQNDKLLKLMSRVGESEYIGKEYACSGKDEIQRMERLIDHKILNSSPFLMRLRRANIKQQDGACSSAKVFFLVFEKPFQTLKEECISRKIKSGRFSEDELECVLEACVKGLFYLKGINQYHGSLSSSCIFLREDRTVLLGDPWVMAHPKSSPLFDLTYPSPQKILFDNRLIQSYNYLLSDLFSLGVIILECLWLQTMDSLYQKGFRRIRYTSIIEKMGVIRGESLMMKMKTLLDHDPLKRNQIFKLCDRKEPLKAGFISRQKQEFKKHYVQSTLQVSEVKTVKPVQEDMHSIINKINQSKDQSEFSNATQPKYNTNVRHMVHPMTATRIPEENRLHTISNLRNPHYPPLMPSHSVQIYQQPLPIINNQDTNARIEHSPLPNQLIKQDTGRVRQPQEHFQQKMSLSSIHQNSSRGSEDISNLQIIAQTNKEDKAVVSVPQAPNSQRPQIKEITTYPIMTKPISQAQQAQHNNFNKLNSTIRQLSDQSPSREDVVDLATGEHQILYQTGTRYKGSIRNGKRDGVGTFFYKDGCFYCGEWSQNRMHGKGKLYSQNDQLIYDGSWYMDSFHGKGLLFNLDPTSLTVPYDYYDLSHIDEVWQQYEGQFFLDKKHGKGTIVLTNQEVYSGNFDNNKVHGQGKYYKMNGEVFSGVWQCGILVGKIK